MIGFVAMVPTFFGTYWNNATWGSDPGTQISGLATAGLTAAFAGLAAAHKLLEKAPTETEREVGRGEVGRAEGGGGETGRTKRVRSDVKHLASAVILVPRRDG